MFYNDWLMVVLRHVNTRRSAFNDYNNTQSIVRPGNYENKSGNNAIHNLIYNKYLAYKRLSCYVHTIDIQTQKNMYVKL